VEDIGNYSDRAFATLVNEFENGVSIRSMYNVSEEGVSVEIIGDGEVAYMLPAFYFDGEEYTDIALNGCRLLISYKGYTCIYTSSAPINDMNRLCANRNGNYKSFYTSAKKRLSIKIEIASDQ
jgi:hypothetical protein